MPLTIDRAVYAVAPRIGIGNGATLLEQLVDVAKGDDSTAIAASLKKLRKVLAKARSVDAAGARANAASTAAGDLELDRRADRCSKAIKLRLEAWPLHDDGEPAQRASAHLRLLFPKGLRFTQASFAIQDAEMRRIVGELKDPELAASLDELVGPSFIKAFKKAAKDYAEMVKAMGRTVEQAVDQRSVVIEMQTTIVQHASRVLGELDDDDSASVERTRMLLQPIDNFRARAASGGGGTSETDDADASEPADGLDA
ncbi:hypothetical protein [Paraliomyxa miuraensis]|uniref:hypothetical protein n=1 Tax=Paraliomyxa miuraensis TaxID=376150 RepID=UPI00224E81B8|nr:hypothetical protein [Paraliomyxa miuraensis]MCX4244411.1 hypothetical protein [Paraliomyxa miuraensis]